MRKISQITTSAYLILSYLTVRKSNTYSEHSQAFMNPTLPETVRTKTMRGVVQMCCHVLYANLSSPAPGGIGFLHYFCIDIV